MYKYELNWLVISLLLQYRTECCFLNNPTTREPVKCQPNRYTLVFLALYYTHLMVAIVRTNEAMLIVTGTVTFISLVNIYQLYTRRFSTRITRHTLWKWLFSYPTGFHVWYPTVWHAKLREVNIAIEVEISAVFRNEVSVYRSFTWTHVFVFIVMS